jgi:PAS domain S-box-containing protein
MGITRLRFPILIRITSLWAILVGVWVIIGWILGIEFMKVSIKDGSSMKFNTAFCAILCGLSVLSQTFEINWFRRLGKFLPWIFVGISILSLFQTYFGVNFGIDELVFTDHVSRLKGIAYPGRTSTVLSICFAFLGFGLLLQDSEKLSYKRVAQWSFHLVTIFTFMFIISYLYRVPFLSDLVIIGSMTFHSSVLMFSLSIICSLFNDNLEVTGMFLDNRLGSRIVRRIFPVVVLIVIIFGLFRASRISQSLIGIEFGVAIFSIGFMLIGLLILSISTYYLNVMESKKNDAEDSLRQLNKDLEETVRKRTMELQQLNHRLKLATSGAKLGVWDVVLSEKKIIGNQPFYEMWGFPKDSEFIWIDEFKQKIHPNDIESTLEVFRKADKLGEKIDFEHRIIVNNLEKYIKVNGVMEYDSNGKAIRVLGVHTDITAQKLIEKELRISYEQIKTFIEEAPTALCMVDKEMKYIAVSKRWLEDYQLGEMNIIGKSHYEVFPEIGDDWKAIHRKCLNGGKDISNGRPFYRADGTVQWLRWTITPWHDSNNEIGGILMQTEDITKEMMQTEVLRQSEEKYHKMVEGVEDYAIILLDTDGNITNWNKGAELIKGYAASEILGKNFKVFYSQEDLVNGLPDTLLKKARLEGKAQHEGIRVKKDGSQFWASVLITTLSDDTGKVIGFAKLTKDITQKKMADDKLRKAKEDAEQLALAKSEFLSVMSHEIRTPMNAVIGFTELLASENPREDQVEYLRILQHSTKHLLSLVNDVLDYSKIEAGKLSFENRPFDLKLVMSNIYHMFNQKAVDKGLKLNLEAIDRLNLFVSGDELRLNQILYNLIGNAIKFTSFGEVSFGIFIDSEDDQQIEVRFQIKDSGIGIPSHKIKTIFDSFSQAEIGTSRKYGGTGLGLSISKKLVELQGGKIWVESDPGNGSTFEFVIKFQKIVTSKAGSMEKNMLDSLNGLRVLIAEDNLVNVLLANRLLEKWNCKTDVASNGLIAVEKVGMNEYDLILMDIQMPEMDGITAAAEIRKREKTGRIPIIALSANAEAELEEKISVDFDAYISKPFEAQKLHGILAVYSQQKAGSLESKV